MPLNNPDQMSSTTVGSSLRIWPADGGIETKEVAAVSGAPLLPLLTPMAYNTSTGIWVVWTNGGANGTGTIKGFLARELQTHATNTALASMLTAGQVHFDDIPVPAGETEGNLITALQSGPRESNLLIKGLADVR